MKRLAQLIVVLSSLACVGPAAEPDTCPFRFTEATTFQRCGAADAGLCFTAGDVPYAGPACTLRSEYSDKAVGICVSECSPLDKGGG